MTDTANLGLPFIEGSQAQKHVTHNEALRMLDAVIQVSVLDADRTSPPPIPFEGDRHIVAPSPTGAWAGHAFAIATWEDSTWRFLAPNTGWIAWSIDDDMLLVFDGSGWRDLRDIPSMVEQLGIHTTADATNRLSVRSNAALFTNIATSDGGSGNIRLQLSKQGASNTASVVFSNAFSGRAEFGLVGSDAFRLKVSPDGSSFTDAFVIDQTSGNLTLPRGIVLAGILSPAQITANQNDYAPTGFAAASVVRVSTDASRNITGLAGGSDGRKVLVLNTGAFNAVLKDENASSTAANRFGFGSDLTLAAKQGATLIYDATASRWRLVGGSGGGGGSGTVTSVATAYPLAGGPISGSGTITSVAPPQCGRLSFVSATAIKFVPYNGDLIKIGGVLYQIPATGIAGVANTSVFVSGTGGQNLAASTLYYVYAFNNSGTITADFSTTAYAMSSSAGNVGTFIKTGDDSRTLIGMVRTNASSQFADSATQRFVLSWFGRRGLGLTGVFTANRTVTSGSWTEFNSEIRVEFLSWSDEIVSANYSGGGFLNNGADQYDVSIAFDGTTPEEGAPVFQGVTAIGPVGCAVHKSGLGEGYHYATMIGHAQSGSSGIVLTGTGTAGRRGALWVRGVG